MAARAPRGWASTLVECIALPLENALAAPRAGEELRMRVDSPYVQSDNLFDTTSEFHG